MLPILIGAVGLAAGFILAGLSGGIVAFAVVHGLLLGLAGSSATFAPLVADASLWFVQAARHRGRDLRQRQLPRRRDLAADRPALRRDGRLAPDLHRHGHLLRRDDAAARPADAGPAAGAGGGRGSQARRRHADARPFGLSMNSAQALLCVAGVACCVAMSMPQVHIVAYCGDLGYGAAPGARCSR